MLSPQQLRDLYRFPGFVPLAGLQTYARDDQGVLLTLRRRQKKLSAAYVAWPTFTTMTNGPATCVTSLVGIDASTSLSIFAASNVDGVAA
jgi:hypothetical protein